MHRLILLWLIFLFSPPSPVNAQEAAQTLANTPLTVGFGSFPPYLHLDEDGTRTGFGVELMEAISIETGIALNYLNVNSPGDYIKAFNTGEIQLSPVIPKLPALETTSVFSKTVATESLRLMTLSERVSELSSVKIENKRIGVVTSTTGSDIEEFLAHNLAIDFPNFDGALVALLAGELDGVLAANPLLFNRARTIKVDNRVSFIGPPIRSVDRFVAVHQSRSNLLPAINRAISKMQADGRLEQLTSKYFIELPEPQPAILRVPIAHSPPYGIITESGEISGFAAELFTDLARRADLAFEFVPVSLTEYFRAASTAGEDVIPIILASDELRARLDFTQPIDRAPLDILVRQDETRFQTIEDLANARVGSFPDTARIAISHGLKAAEITEFESTQEIVTALENHEIDAIIDVAHTLEDERTAKQFKSIGSLDFQVVNVIGLRPGLGAVRERLNAVIPGYLLSDEFALLRQTYFGTDKFWTPARLISTEVISGTVLLIALGVATGLAFRTRALKRARSKMLSISDELETIFNVATCGIVALNSEGQILRTNNRARHFLGGISTPTPFAWPESIQFLDAESMQPLEASADPIKRILSDNQLNNETQLMRRMQPGPDHRYVRIGSARVENKQSNIQQVLVIDDVSDEERNRQVVERKNRLDALGQLTGGIAHDFNNLLASQLFSVNLARTVNDENKRDEYLELASNSIERGRALTARLLAFARKQPGHTTVRLTSEVLDEFKKLIRPMLEAHIELTISVSESTLRHKCDQTQLETALMNLVLNSRDAILRAAKGNRIDVKARPVRSNNSDLDNRQNDVNAKTQKGTSYRYVEISVSDNGPGMDDETLTRSTDPFFTTKETNSGTGLGLAMVYGFIRQSDGDLRIYTELGVGTTVQMTIPRGTEQGEREQPVSEDPVQAGDGQTIMLVEDELDLLAIMVDVLENLGYQVITANSGYDALKQVKAGKNFDLLLTDVVMPGGIGGFELARRVRKVQPNLPVVYTSGYTGFSSAEMGEVKAPLLQKPTPPEELAKTIAEALATQKDRETTTPA